MTSEVLTLEELEEERARQKTYSLMYARRKREEFLAYRLDCIHQRFREHFEVLGDGRHKTSYGINDNIVVKIPNIIDAFEVIFDEWLIYKAHCYENQHAHTELHMIGSVPVLHSERVEVLYEPTSKNYTKTAADLGLPRWTEDTDLFQVGRTKDGLIVAYDFGDEFQYQSVERRREIDALLRTLCGYDRLVSVA